MKNNIVRNILALSASLITFTGCYQDQEVAPVVSPERGSVLTITPRESYSNVKEGDILYYDVTTNALVAQAIDFGAIFNSNSVGGADDIEVSGTLGTNSYSTVITVTIVDDGILEPLETLSFNLNADGDPGYNFQLSPESDDEIVNLSIVDYTMSIDWSEVMVDDQGACDLGIDIDLYLLDGDFGIVNQDGASSHCPDETANIGGNLADGTYYVYASVWDYGDTEGNNIDVPYTFTFSNNSGDFYTFSGSFNSSTAYDDSNTIPGYIVVENGVYTLYDMSDNVVGTI